MARTVSEGPAAFFERRRAQPPEASTCRTARCTTASRRVCRHRRHPSGCPGSSGGRTWPRRTMSSASSGCGHRTGTAAKSIPAKSSRVRSSPRVNCLGGSGVRRTGCREDRRRRPWRPRRSRCRRSTSPIRGGSSFGACAAQGEMPPGPAAGCSGAPPLSPASCRRLSARPRMSVPRPAWADARRAGRPRCGRRPARRLGSA